jgi:hypothetical protein
MAHGDCTVYAGAHRLIDIDDHMDGSAAADRME